MVRHTLKILQHMLQVFKMCPTILGHLNHEVNAGGVFFQGIWPWSHINLVAGIPP